MISEEEQEGEGKTAQESIVYLPSATAQKNQPSL
jgi:hypothetical protein